MSQENPNREAALAEIAEATGADAPSAPAAPAAAPAPAAPAAAGTPSNSLADVGTGLADMASDVPRVAERAVTDPVGTAESIGRGATSIGGDLGRSAAHFGTRIADGAARIPSSPIGAGVAAAANTVGNAIDNAPTALGEAARAGGVGRPSTMQPGLMPTTTAAVEAPPGPDDEPEAGPGAVGTPHG